MTESQMIQIKKLLVDIGCGPSAGTSASHEILLLEDYVDESINNADEIDIIINNIKRESEN